MVEKVEDAITSMDEKMSASLARIEERLTFLEAKTNYPAPIPYETCEMVSVKFCL